MLKVGFRQADITRAAESTAPDRLRMSGFNAGPRCVLLPEVFAVCCPSRSGVNGPGEFATSVNSRVTSRHVDQSNASRVFMSRSNRPYGLTCSHIKGVRAA